MRTQSVSEKRSRSLRLEFHPDFWEFYRRNRASVDHIIGVAIIKASAKYPSYIPSKLEPGDIKSDVMRLLFLNKFMESWDSSKSQLNTYFTNKARWYVKRVIQKVVDAHSNITSRIGYQVAVEGLNDVDDCAMELASKYSTEDDIIGSDYEEVLSEHLDERTREVAKLTTQGLSQSEIADIYEVSKPSIGGYCQVIRDTAKMLFCEPKITTIPKSSKNNHGRNKKRPLTGMEKSRIQEQFLAVNGIVKNDFCLRLKNEVGSNVSIFQVTGYVKELHNKVKSGDLQVADLASYMTLREQRRQLWASYRSERYRKMREKLYGQAV
jgi:hypothetical protein